MFDIKSKSETLRDIGCVLVVHREGKFGDEALIPLNSLPIVESRSTEKAFFCGEFNPYRKNYDLFGWISKKMLVDYDGEMFVPVWIVDKWNWTHLGTNVMNNDYFSHYYSKTDKYIKCRTEYIKIA